MTFVPDPNKNFKCKALTANMGANDPQECNWPVCGCDPWADKVIAALQEHGLLNDKALKEALKAAIAECRNHNNDYHHRTPDEALHQWEALL